MMARVGMEMGAEFAKRNARARVMIFLIVGALATANLASFLAKDTSVAADGGPVVLFSTLLGGTGGSFPAGVGVDGAGNIYVAGANGASRDFPAAGGGSQPINQDISLAKLDPTGSTLLRTTFLGGDTTKSFNRVDALIVDSAGNAYLTGATSAKDMTVTDTAVQKTYAGGPQGNGNADAFVMKVDPSGNVVYSTFVGGNNFDEGLAITADSAGVMTVLFGTYSNDLPTADGAAQKTFGGGQTDMYVMRIDPANATPVYATYLGGSDSDWDCECGIALDSAGNAVVIGATKSANFPTTPGAYQTAPKASNTAFIAKLNATGGFIFSTLLGGTKGDYGRAVAVDSADTILIGGTTQSGDFPVTDGAAQKTLGGTQDAWFARMDPSGGKLLYATYLGGDGSDSGFVIALDHGGNAWFAGRTASRNMPVTDGSTQKAVSPGSNGFVARFDPTGALTYATYIGGSGFDEVDYLALDSADNLIAVSNTNSPDTLATQGAFQMNYAGGTYQTLVTKIGQGTAAPLATRPTLLGAPPQPVSVPLGATAATVATKPIAAFPDSDQRRFFPDTKHALAGAFKVYWENNGGQGAFGLPTSEPFVVGDGNGHRYVVQDFEKMRLEYHPESAGTPTEVVAKPRS